MNILIADDEKDTIFDLANFLTRQGHQITLVHDGKEAVKLIENQEFDFIFVDHNMPEMTGLEVIKHVKKIGKKAKMVMITSYPEMEDFLAESVGAYAYIEKPFQLDQIMTLLK